ncbi:hypothetical protein SAMN02745116_02343 [Pilibacter termitis]|uniref:Uncharacterized protein n=1 Tax=Pilibacter termitis TaxID=263852 RepID=A0A1T4QVW2_9ENTE|nr:hypothetical protein [Pilibacter termitis]SKA07825.1 hypothetical protein SAMN02745116_02343 [Pilibacter termitis]
MNFDIVKYSKKTFTIAISTIFIGAFIKMFFVNSYLKEEIEPEIKIFAFAGMIIILMVISCVQAVYFWLMYSKLFFKTYCVPVKNISRLKITMLYYICILVCDLTMIGITNGAVGVEILLLAQILLFPVLAYSYVIEIGRLAKIKRTFLSEVGSFAIIATFFYLMKEWSTISVLLFYFMVLLNIFYVLLEIRKFENAKKK